MRILDSARTLFGRIAGRDTSLREAQAAVAAVANAWGRTYDIELVLHGARRHPYPTLRNRTKPAGQQLTNTAVLEGLAAGGRDILEVAARKRTEIIRDTLSRITPGSTPSPNTVMYFLGLAYLRQVLHVAETGEGLRPNAASWTERKRRLGLATTPGRASGQLLDALRKATIRIVPR